MAIAYSTIETLLKAALDSEGSDRYTATQDFIPAINYAQDFMVLAFNSIFAKKKLSEEVLKELTYVKVWFTSSCSRIAFDPTIVGMDLWTIIAVYPKPTIVKKAYAPPVVGDESIFMPLDSYISSNYVAKRLTLEEWTLKNSNCFMAGNSFQTCPDLIEYAWVNFADYHGGYTLTNNKFEIEISPAVPGEKVAVAFLKKPEKVTTTASVLEFPDVLLTMIVEKSLNFIAQKQNNTTNLYTVSALDVKNIVSLLT